MSTATTTPIEWRVVRTDHFLEARRGEPGGLTMCDSGPTSTAIVHSGKTMVSLDEIKQKWEGQHFRLYVDYNSEEYDRGDNFDGSNYVLEVKNGDGEWEKVKAIFPFNITGKEQCMNCREWHTGTDPDLCAGCIALNPCEDCGFREEGIEKDGYCANCTRYFAERFGG